MVLRSVSLHTKGLCVVLQGELIIILTITFKKDLSDFSSNNHSKWVLEVSLIFKIKLFSLESAPKTWNPSWKNIYSLMESSGDEIGKKKYNEFYKQ